MLYFLLQICTVLHDNDIDDMVGLFFCSRTIRRMSVLAFGVLPSTCTNGLLGDVFMVYLLESIQSTHEYFDVGNSGFANITQPSVLNCSTNSSYWKRRFVYLHAISSLYNDTVEALCKLYYWNIIFWKF